MRSESFKKLLIRLVESCALDRETAQSILARILEKQAAGSGERPKK